MFWKQVLKDYPAALTETLSLQLCSVLLNPASVMTPRSSVLVTAFIAKSKIQDGLKM